MDKAEILKEKRESEKTGLVKRIRLFFDKTSGGYSENPVVIWLVLVCILVNVANWLAIAIFIKPTSENIILHYNVYFGVDLKENFRQAYSLPSSGLIILIFNLFLGGFFFRNKERVASYVLLMTALMANLSLGIAVLSIIIINY